jgi:REP element-mobilizing transposase RayT
MRMHQTRAAAFVHMNWATCERAPLLSGEVEQQVYRSIGAKCAELSAKLVALGGVDDHVHMLVCLHTSLGLSELMMQAKGTSAHLVTHEVAPGELFRWQGGYGAFSANPCHLRKVSDYIINQRKQYTIWTLMPKLEPEYDYADLDDRIESAQADFAARSLAATLVERPSSTEQHPADD